MNTNINTLMKFTSTKQGCEKVIDSLNIMESHAETVDESDLIKKAINNVFDKINLLGGMKCQN